MREHYNKCITNNIFEPFPSCERMPKRNQGRDTQHYFNCREKKFVDPTKHKSPIKFK